METKIITIDVDGKVVEYNVRTETWTCDKIAQEAVKTLNDELYKKIINALKSSVEEYQTLVKKEEEEKRLKALKFAVSKQNEFRNIIEPLFDSSYELRFKDLTNEKYFNNNDAKRVYITKEKVSFTLYYDDVIYRRGSWHSSKTDKSWCVDFDYKTTRYVKIESAVKSIKKKIEIVIADNIRKEESKNNKANIDMHYKQTFEPLGYIYERDIRWHKNGTTETPKIRTTIKTITEYNKVALFANVYSKKDNDDVFVKDIKINGRMSLEQLQKLKAFVESIEFEE